MVSVGLRSDMAVFLPFLAQLCLLWQQPSLPPSSNFPCP